MCKLAFAIAAVFLLLLAELVIANPEAAALSGIMDLKPGTTHSLAQKAACEEANEQCEKGKEVVCTPGGPDPQCTCDSCQANITLRCPRYPACNCNPGTLCAGLSTGNFCLCPK